MRRVTSLIAALAVLVYGTLGVVPAHLNAAGGPLASPTSVVRFYLHALGTSQCDLAFKFAGQHSGSLSDFRQSCRAIRRNSIGKLEDPGYRLHPQTATYTCLAIRYTVYRRDSSATTFGGWYLMERTLGPAWRILFPSSHVVRDGSAVLLTKSQCVGHVPSYVQPGSGTLISGSAFPSASVGWIALSTSGSYLPSGSCSHGIGSNCESASTIVYRTDDAGRHWTPLRHFATAVGPPIWIRRFSQRVWYVVGTVGPLRATAHYHFTAALFVTRDGGKHWQRFPLPRNYSTQTGSISFPDPQHGWLWYGGGAMGSMALDVFRTADGGRHWNRVACTAFSNPGPGYSCAHPSGIGLGGDKEYLTFRNTKDGWLTVYENTGVPDLHHTEDGGTSWRRQGVGLPASVTPPNSRSTTFPSGTLLQPQFFGQIGILPERVGFYRAKPHATWSRLYIFRSTDGGRTWRSAVRTPITGPSLLWQAIDSRHWAFATATALWSTDNAGSTWTKHSFHLPAGLVLVDLDFTSPRSGWATTQTHADSGVSALGTVLLRTVDGGVHWKVVRLP